MPSAWLAFERSLAEVLGYPQLATAVRMETELLWLAFSGWFRQPEIRKDVQNFTVYRKVSWFPLLGALLFLSTAELGLIHYFLARAGWTTLALVSLAIHVYGYLWLIGDAQTLRLRPIRVSRRRLDFDLGLRWHCSLPAERVDAVQLCPNPRAKGFRMVLFGNPNVLLRLREEVEITGLFGIHRQSDRLLLQLDDPEGFCKAVEQLIHE